MKYKSLSYDITHTAHLLLILSNSLNSETVNIFSQVRAVQYINHHTLHYLHKDSTTLDIPLFFSSIE